MSTTVQRLYAYRPRGSTFPDEPRSIMRWFHKGEAPATIEEDGLVWELVPDRPRDTTQAMRETIHGFKSISLPRWWPWAPRHDKDGACIFNGQTEAQEACKRAQAAGEHVSWDF